jgi:hypothetical protein
MERLNEAVSGNGQDKQPNGLSVREAADFGSRITKPSAGNTERFDFDFDSSSPFSKLVLKIQFRWDEESQQPLRSRVWVTRWRESGTGVFGQATAHSLQRPVNPSEEPPVSLPSQQSQASGLN